MSAEESKAIVRRYFEETHNAKNLTVIDELCSPEFAESQRPWFEVFHKAVPDARFTVHDAIAEADRVVLRCSVVGTHAGEFPTPLGPAPATHRQVTVTEILIYRVSGGKLVEGWIEVDWLRLLQQFGMIKAEREAKGQEGNKEIVRRVTDVVNKLLGGAQDDGSIDQLCSPEIARRIRENLIPWSLSTFGDSHHGEMIDMIAEGDRVWLRIATSGDHVGEFMGIQPTHRKWTNRGVEFYRLENGRIVELEGFWDVLNHLQQLGATVTPPEASG